jgi:hypothetical protein
MIKSEKKKIPKNYLCIFKYYTFLIYNLLKSFYHFGKIKIYFLK